MDAEIARYKKEYPNLDPLMIETILKMSEEEHIKFQTGLEKGEMCEAPKQFVYKDAIEVINSEDEIINSSAAEGQTDV